VAGNETPLLTPAKLDDDSRRSSDRECQDNSIRESVNDLEDENTAQAKAVRRRRAELLRRVSEIAFMASLEGLALFKQRIWWSLSRTEKSKLKLTPTH
jgi:hypothetical protein